MDRKLEDSLSLLLSNHLCIDFESRLHFYIDFKSEIFTDDPCLDGIKNVGYNIKKMTEMRKFLKAIKVLEYRTEDTEN